MTSGPKTLLATFDLDGLGDGVYGVNAWLCFWRAVPVELFKAGDSFYCGDVIPDSYVIGVRSSLGHHLQQLVERIRTDAIYTRLAGRRGVVCGTPSVDGLVQAGFINSQGEYVKQYADTAPTALKRIAGFASFEKNLRVLGVKGEAPGIWNQRVGSIGLLTVSTEALGGRTLYPEFAGQIGELESLWGNVQFELRNSFDSTIKHDCLCHVTFQFGQRIYNCTAKCQSIRYFTVQGEIQEERAISST